MYKNFIRLQVLLIPVLLACSSDDVSPETPTPDNSDKIKPTISCIEDIIVTTDQSEVIVDYTAPVGTDNKEGAVTIQTEGFASGEKFPIGTTKNIYQVKDKAGNISFCSFNVVVNPQSPSDSAPFFLGDNPTPDGKKWVKVDALSDEFNVPEFNNAKWYKDPTKDQFRWRGRFPGLFEPENVSIGDGNLRVTVKEFDTPKRVNGQDWTHGGAILRSKAKATPGLYYECRMQANKTVMSSTFWIAFPQNCNSTDKRKLELDIQECVGRVHDSTAVWAQKWDAIYHSNTWRHNFGGNGCDKEITKSIQSPGKINLDEKNNSRYFVYGCWWKSPTEILFYLDGKFTYRITPLTDFDIDGHITMAMETYDWNPIDKDNIFDTASEEDRTTKYDWVRTWKLEDE